MTLRLVGGAANGDLAASSVWEDGATGPERVLRCALGAGLTRVSLVGVDSSGALYVASSVVTIEETMGLFMRGVGFLQDQPQ